MDWDRTQATLPGRAGTLAHNLRVIESLTTTRPRLKSAPLPTFALPQLPLWTIGLFVAGTLQAALACGGLVMRSQGQDAGPAWLLVATSVTYVVAAGFLLHGSAGDPRARWLAAFFLAVASASAQPELGRLAAQGTFRWAALLRIETLLPYFLWRFVRDFPRVLHMSRSSQWVDIGSRLALAVGVALLLANGLPGAVSLGGLQLARDSPGSLYWPVTLASALAAVLVALVRTRSASSPERQRVALLVWGVALGIGPGFLLVLLEQWIPAVNRFTDLPVARFYSDLLLYLPLISIPVTAAYAVQARHVLDVRLLLHRALARAAVSRGLTTLALASAAALTASVYWNRELSARQLLESTALSALLGLGVGAGALLACWERLLSLLENSGSGARADAGRIIAAFSQETGAARTPIEIVEALSEQGRRGLQVERAGLFLRSADGGDFVPQGGAGRPISQRSALVTLLATDATPIVLDPWEPQALLRWLPQADQEWLADANVGLLSPIVGADGAVSGLIVLSSRRDGAPFTREQQVLGTALTSAAALALRGFDRETPPGAAFSDSPVRECRTCGALARDTEELCGCGTAFSVGVIPRNLNGRFRVERVLGRGGMGVVYLGRDLELDRSVALKTLPRVRAEALVRLRHEARSMAQFIHPHLALIFGAESWRGVPVLVVEHLSGGTLAQRLREPAPVADVLAWGIHLASALDAMHGKGLLHRDVKPSNIGFNEDGLPKLLDFGLARLVDEIGETADEEPTTWPRDARVTQSRHVLGTLLYLSPEARAGVPPSSAQDLWALAVVLWEALAGRHPFADSVDEPGLQRLPRAADVSSVRPTCPADLAALLSEALDPRQEHRPATAQALRDRLAACARTNSSV